MEEKREKEKIFIAVGYEPDEDDPQILGASRSKDSAWAMIIKFIKSEYPEEQAKQLLYNIDFERNILCENSTTAVAYISNVTLQ